MPREEDERFYLLSLVLAFCGCFIFWECFLPQSRGLRIFADVIYLGFIFGITFLFYRERNSKKLSAIKLKLKKAGFPRDSNYLTVLCFVAGAGLACLASNFYNAFETTWLHHALYLTHENQRLLKVVDDIRKLPFWGQMVAWMIILGLLSAFLGLTALWEEFIFRKCFLCLFTKSSVPFASILVSFLFAVCHKKNNWIAFFVVFALSMILNELYLKTGNLLNTIFVHFTYDLFVFYFALSRITLGLFLFTIELIICLLVLLLLIYIAHHFKSEYVSYPRPAKPPKYFLSLVYGFSLVFLLVKILNGSSFN